MITDKIDIPNDPPAVRQSGPRQSANETRVVDTSDLFRGDSEIMIRHEGAIYRMKITRQGKLILNK